MRNRVVITGLGCISPLGNTVDEAWQSLMAGKSGAGPITHFDASQHKTRFACEVKNFDPAALFGAREARRMDRFTQFAVAASQQALIHSGLEVSDSNRDRVGVVVGSGIGGIGTLAEQVGVMAAKGPDRVSPFLVPMMISDTAAGMTAIHLGLRGPNMAVVTACASGNNAIGEATEMIRRGSADAMLAGGAEAAIVAITIAGMNVMGALSTRNDEPLTASRPFDKTRDGFVMGEGGVMLVLESLDHALARGATILAEVAGYGTTDDAYHVSAPAENGSGAAICMKIAIDDAGLDVTEIDYINAHGTSTTLNDKSETAAIKTVFGEQAHKVAVSSTKSMTGHMIGAAGAMEALISTLVFQHNMLPATINYVNPDPDCDLDIIPNTPRPATPRHIMSNSFGFGGHNATLVFSRYNG
ncbi:MAG: beta-ketoacyl-[acyl-carrier-protein] synthase II [Chloroflexi bacterium HGW-Chloroflexi-6]|nr:MAG: beta-ketoacyl-[acyl-carrier-protein] synthase II [Chloroflexi bacterium HGW-Chloroflexi-6]